MSETFNTKEYLAERNRIAALVTLDGSVISIHGPSEWPYEIAIDRCDTEGKILSWVHHLNEKTWMTPEIINRFMEVAGARIGWKPDHIPA